MGDKESYSVVRPMGLTHEEFLRTLPAAASGMDSRLDATGILLESSTRRVRIRLGPVLERRLGSLVLPRTEVSLSFEGFSVSEREDFLRRFDLAFQRGGG